MVFVEAGRHAAETSIKHLTDGEHEDEDLKMEATQDSILEFPNTDGSFISILLASRNNWAASAGKVTNPAFTRADHLGVERKKEGEIQKKETGLSSAALMRMPRNRCARFSQSYTVTE